MISQKHGTCPKTNDRSKDSPVDCIFGSVSLKISKGGFLSFGRLLSDNRDVWMYIPKFLLYRYNPPKLVFHGERKLKLTDSRVAEKYCTYLHCAMRDNDLFKRMDGVHRNALYMEEKLA